MNAPAQARWYGADLFAQDRDLCDFVLDNQITSIRYLGDCERLRSILGQENEQTYQLCVMVYNRPFRFSEVVTECNEMLPTLTKNGFLYVSINKFLAVPEPNNNHVKDYDLAILNLMLERVPWPLIRYHSGVCDSGKRFNWIHPLTRFIFSHADS